MDINQVEHVLCKSQHDGKVVVVKYVDGSEVMGWVQRYNPNTNPKTFIMIVNNRDYHFVEVKKVSSVLVTEDTF